MESLTLPEKGGIKGRFSALLKGSNQCRVFVNGSQEGAGSMSLFVTAMLALAGGYVVYEGFSCAYGLSTVEKTADKDPPSVIVQVRAWLSTILHLLLVVLGIYTMLAHSVRCNPWLGASLVAIMAFVGYLVSLVLTPTEVQACLKQKYETDVGLLKDR